MRETSGSNRFAAKSSGELERRFLPEFRNRIDEIVLFAPLTKADVRVIAQQYLHQIATTLSRSGKMLEVEPAALERLVDAGSNLAYGARFLKRVIDEHVKIPISSR